MKKIIWKPLLFTLIIVLAIFIGIYVIFINPFGITAGIFLKRTDWLAFIVAYLSFAGTIIVSIVTVYQAQYFNDQENKRRIDELPNLPDGRWFVV